MAIDEQSKQHEPLLIAPTSHLLGTSAPNRPELSGNVNIGHNTAKQHDRLINNAATESKHDDEKSETAATAAQRLPKLRQQEEEKQAPQSESQSE